MINLEKEAKETNALVLAFLGDAVYTLKVKEFLVRENIVKAGELNRMATKFVKASAQAQVFDRIKGELTANEQNIAGRAKNVHTSNVPKNSNLEEYKKATSLEAIVGYNHLCGNNARIDEIIKKARELQ